MRRMHPSDSLWYYGDLPDAMTHTIKFGVIDPKTQPGVCDINWLRGIMARLLPNLGPMHQVACPTPFGINHPLLIEAGKVDLEHHVRRIGVPPPGTDADVSEVISNLVEHRLPRDKPLWQMWMLEGLKDGRIGILLILHHAIADGTAAAELINRIYMPEPGQIPPAVLNLPQEERPSWLGRLAMGIFDLPGVLLRYVPPYLKAKRQLKQWVEETGSEIEKYATPLRAPKTMFNAVLSPRRTFTRCSIPLERLEPIRAAHKVTINDIVLTLVSGAARRYLQEYDRIPDVPLVGAMPMTNRPEGIKEEIFGNDIIAEFVWLHVEIEDPVARLLAMHKATQDTKEHFEHTRDISLTKKMGLFPPIWWSVTPRLAKAQKGAPTLFGNIMVSNVRGPAEPLWLDQARLDEFYSIGHIVHGGGLNMTVWSYAGQLRLCVYTCPLVVPEAQKLVTYFSDALDELLEAVETAPQAQEAQEN